VSGRKNTSRGGPAVFYGERDSGSVGDLSDYGNSADRSDADIEQGDGEMKEQDDAEDDAEDDDNDGAENVSQEEDISEPPPDSSEPQSVSEPTPARKSTKKATGRGAVGEKVKSVESRAQKDRRNETKQKKNRKASKDGHGNAAGDKRPEFFINKEALKGITGQANAAMPHFQSLFQRFETFLLKDKKVEKTWKEFSDRFPKVLFYSKKRSENAKKLTPVLKEGGQVALFISRNNAKEFVLVAMFGSAYLAERMMGSSTDVISKALNQSEDGISGKYEDDFCHWRRATVK
jgi:hypothetical protein